MNSQETGRSDLIFQPDLLLEQSTSDILGKKPPYFQKWILQI